MPIAIVTLSDTLDQWRQKDNQMITKVNSLSAAASVLSVANAAPGQTFVFDGTAFHNVAISGDLTIDSNGVATLSGGAVGGMTKGRIRFAGCVSSLY